jgi:PAS domain S-box-containing protein
MENKINPEDIIEIHENALQHLAQVLPDQSLANTAQLVVKPLVEMLMGISLVYRERLATRDQLNEVLRQSEKRLLKAQRLGHLGFAERDLKTNNVFLSDETYRIHGFKQQENRAPLELLMNAVHPDDLGFVQKSMDSLIKNREKISFDHRIVRPDGEVRWVNKQTDITFDADGSPGKILGTVLDITERVQAQKDIRQERDKAQKYLDIAKVMIVALNREGEITLVNQKGASILGYQTEELIGKNWFDNFLLKREIESGKKSYIELITGKIEVFDHFEETIVTKSGEERIIDWHSTPLLDEEKHTIGILSSGEDITERKQAVQKLQESEKFQKTIFETTSLATIIIEEDTTISMVNNEFEKLSGYSKEELEGKMSWTVFVVKEDLTRMKEYHQQRRIDPDTTLKQYEFLFINRKGIVRNILLHVDLIPGTKKSVASFLDFTERVRAERLLNALNRAAVAMGTAQTHHGIFNAVAEQLKQLDISCMLFPLDEMQSNLFTKYISYESAVLNTAEKLVGIKHEDFSFTINAVDMYGEVVREKKTLFSDNSEQIFQQILPKFTKKLTAQIIKLMHVQKSISAPLIVADQVIGVFSIQSDTLTQEDVPAATAFADQLSSAWNKVKLLKDLRKTLEGTIRTIAATVEVRDPYTAGHQTRVSDLAAAIAIEMKLADEQVEGIKMAGIIHDLGKINIPAEILSKPGKLSDLEFQIIKTHPQIGFDLLKEIEFPWPIAEMILQHHEKIDGSGYPQGLKVDEILLEARILAVADIVEAMSSHRPYRPAHGIEKALKQIKRDKGTLLDPKVVDACLKIFKDGYKLLEI